MSLGMSLYNLTQSNPDVLGVKATAVAGQEVGKNPKMREAFERLQRPSTEKDKANYEAWYSKLRASNNRLQESPYNHRDYNMYGFWQGSQIPNSGANTQINQNDGLVHFADNYIDRNGNVVQLKAPWHPAKWTTQASDLLQGGSITEQDIKNINDWNARRLGTEYGGW